MSYSDSTFSPPTFHLTSSSFSEMVELFSSIASLFSKGAGHVPDPRIAMPWELYRDVPSKMASAAAHGYNPYREFNSWVNDVFFSYTVR